MCPPSTIELPRGYHGRLRIIPRWPALRVLIDTETLTALAKAQDILDEDIRLILTRGFEPGTSRLGGLRTFSRAIGIMVFNMVFPHRRDEIADIFGSNGHDIDGRHIDVSIAFRGYRLRFLPLSVFTPSSWQAQRTALHADILLSVHTALVVAGFTIHRNPTESLQIHCDYQSVI